MGDSGLQATLSKITCKSAFFPKRKVSLIMNSFLLFRVISLSSTHCPRLRSIIDQYPIYKQPFVNM